jgi:DNA-directed RNA polymerase specialized sigma24 family protein
VQNGPSRTPLVAAHARIASSRALLAASRPPLATTVARLSVSAILLVVSEDPPSRSGRAKDAEPAVPASSEPVNEPKGAPEGESAPPEHAHPVVILVPVAPEGDAGAFTGVTTEVVRAFVGRKDVQKKLKRLLEGRLPRDEVENVLQDTLERALRGPSRPRTEASMGGWLSSIGHYAANDFYREQDKRRRAETAFAHHEPGDDDAGSGPLDVVPFLDQELAKPENAKDRETYALIVRKAREKLSYEALAAETSSTPDAVRMRFARFGRKYSRAFRRRRNFLLLGVLVLLVVSAAIAAIVRARPPRIEAEPPYAPPSAAPPRTDLDIARELRDEAVRGCHEGAWGRCRDLLDEARSLDPAGETEPRVQAARRALRDQRERTAVPPENDKAPRNEKGPPDGKR